MKEGLHDNLKQPKTMSPY